MRGPSERMLELLSLLQNGRSRQSAELARRLGTSPRTLRRDIDRLRELGYPVSSERGPYGRYQLVAGKAMPPLLLTDEEAVATVVGLRLARLAHIDAGEAPESALRKLEQVLPPRLRNRIVGVAASTDAVTRAARAVNLHTLQSLGTAAYSYQDVRFGYTNRAGERSERSVQPYRQVLLGKRWYLLGWDLDRADWRTFRIDRIDELCVPGSTFAPRDLPAEGPVSFVQASARYPITRDQGVVRFHAPVDVVSERLMTEGGALEAIDERSCRYTTAPDSWQWLAITLPMVGVSYTIEGPQELIDCSREVAGRIGAATDGAVAE